ncbi:cytochrome P450 716B2 [Selaginella moellendorffii]|nr:cytochrome P450 716B2 [Selaginella moellendorffii]|eukprot:XP_002980510.2 cytochrome P450 716B2 [Selaginella moellendorffii]
MVPVLVLYLLCIGAAALAYLQRWRRFKAMDLPPGSLGLPLLGETLQFIRYTKSNRPWEFIEQREAKYGKIFKTSLFGSPMVMVSPPQGNKLVFSNHNLLVETAWPSPMKTLVGSNAINFMSGEEAKSFRDVLMTFLSAQAVQSQVVPTSNMIQDHLHKHWKHGETVLAYSLIKQALFSVTCCAFLSVSDEEEQLELLEPLAKIIKGLISLPLDLPWTNFHHAKKGRVELYKMFDKYIARRRIELENGSSSQQDLLSLLLSTKLDNGKLMNDDQIKDNILSLLFAGHDTSSSSLAMTLKCLAQNPACYQELRREHLDILSAKQPGEELNQNDLRKMKYTWMVIQETLRVMPTGFGILRKALKDIEMDGFTIPKGWQLLISGYRSYRKPEFFAEPFKFEPSRFAEGTGPVPYTYIPFGGGPRICPGIQLAKMQVMVFLHHLVTRYEWTLVEPDEPVSYTPVAMPTKGLPIKLK